ncbi:MAG: S41 family peptidase [Bacteroidota bacterium]
MINSSFYFLLVFIFASCSSGKFTDEKKVIELQPTYLEENSQINTLIKGVWKSIGNGYYLEAKEDSILLYSYTSSFCYKEKNDYLEGLLNSQSKFALRGDTLEIYLTDFGEATTRLQTKKDFVRVPKLPNNCVNFKEMRSFNLSKLYDLYIETLEENYAFAERRNLNWDLIQEQYQSRVASNSGMDSLFAVLGDIATLTKDQHTKVISPLGKTLQYRVTRSAEVVKRAFEKQLETEDLNKYFNLFFEANYKNISDSLLNGNGKKALNKKIEWGQLNERVGYINIHSFSGLLGKEFTRKQQIDSLNHRMREIIVSFKDKDAIIVDVSFNFGGYDAVALTIAGYFTDIPTFSHKSQVYKEDGFYDEDIVIVHPSDSISFTKPVYVLMTDISRSAAEGFAMMMGALPNVKLVGTNTLGTLSGMLGKSIGDFYTTYSHQRLLNDKNQYYEAQGVEPDIRMSVFPENNVFNGHKIAVKNIVDMIQ